MTALSMLARSLHRSLLRPIQQSVRVFTALPAEDNSGISSSVQQEVGIAKCL